MSVLVLEDVVHLIRFDPAAQALDFTVRGKDRPGVIAEVTTRLEEHGLYVASITFNLVRASQEEYEMEILAKGDPAGLRRVREMVQAGEILEAGPARPERRIDWPTAYLFHLALQTPDREGLTASVSRIVSRPRATRSPHVCPNGSFVHMVGLTQNSGGAHGGTAWFSLRANIATQALEVQRQIVAELEEWSKDHIDGHLWVRDLNDPLLVP